LTAMVAHVLRFFIIHHERPPVLLLLDEIGTAPVIPSLVQKLNTIRSRNLPTWLYFQTLEQMQPYGQTKDQGPNLILGACDMQMVFRLNDNSAAEWMSKRLGVVDRTIETSSVQIGAYAQVSRSLVTEPLLWPHQLQALAPSEVVCTYRGQTWRGRATPYYRLWPALQDQRPKGEDLRGPPYPAAQVPLQVVAEAG
jgi:type IV secretory pathway TraG/TraD family ATPase VirD4